MTEVRIQGWLSKFCLVISEQDQRFIQIVLFKQTEYQKIYLIVAFWEKEV